MRKIILFLLVLILVLPLNLFAQTKPAKLKIGFITALSGFAAYWGVPGRQGAELAVKELRRQGYDVQLVFEDSEANPTKAVLAAQKLINIDKVDALYVEFTAPSQAVAPVAASAKKVMYFDTFDNEPLGANPYALKSFFDIRKVCRTAAEYARKNKIQKIGYIGPRLPIVPQCVEELKTKYGANLFVETLPTPKDSDYRTALLKLKNKAIGLLVSIAYEDNLLNIQKQKLEQKFNVPIFCAVADCYTDKIRKELRSEAIEDNIVFALRVNPAFIKKFTKIYQTSQVKMEAVAISYDAIYYLARGLSKCQTKNPRCVINKVMADQDYKSQVKSKGFGKDRKLQIDTYYYKIENGQLKPIKI